MHVWILTTSERDDEFCDHDSNIVTVYSKEKFNEARKHYTKLCKDRVEKGYEITRCKNKSGYHFSAEKESYNGFKTKCVSLKKVEVV